MMQKLFRPITALFLVAVMVLGVGPPQRSNVASADQRPVGCYRNGVHLFVEKLVPAVVHFGTNVVFQVGVSNEGTGNCAATDMTVDLTTPDGVTHEVVTGLSLQPGEVTALYSVNYAIRAEDVQNNKVTATATLDGSVHTQDSDVASDLKTISVSIEPAITVDSICTIGRTATRDPRIEVKGTTTDAVAPSVVTTVTTEIGTASHTATPLADGSWTDVFPWTQPAGPYDVTATVKYGVGNTKSTTKNFTIAMITIAGGESVATHLRRPTISGTTDAAPGTAVLVTVNSVSEPTTVQAGGTWSVTWQQDLTYGTTYDVEARLNGGASCASDTQSILIANQAPIPDDDAYQTDEDTPLTVPVPGVLSNDDDPDGDPITALQYTSPSNGTAGLNLDGSFTYTPKADWFGVDTFTYWANDGIVNSAEATVTITVKPVNDAPKAADDNYSTPEDTRLDIDVPGLLVNDTDVDGDLLTVDLGYTDTAHGVLTVSGNGSFVYDPDPNWSGVDTFTYQANDGTTNSNVATVTITVGPVNDPPVAVNDDYTTDEDVPLNVSAPGVLANDSDVEADPLTAALVAGPANGTLTLNSNGSFTYTPNENWSGTDTFTYRANDGKDDSNLAIVTITVRPVNDAPKAYDDTYYMQENETLTVDIPGVLVNDTDVEGDSLTAVHHSAPAHGTLVPNSDGSFTYTPDPGYSGQDSFTYQANDGLLDSNVATVTIHINHPNQPPVAVNDSYSTYERTPLNVPAPGVLTNDSDPEGDQIFAYVVTTPSQGTVVLNPDGSFTYVPNASATGSDSFTYKVKDAAVYSSPATVTITLIPPPPINPPQAYNDTYSTNEGQVLTIAAPGVLDNDVNPGGGQLSASKATNPGKGTVTLQSNGSFVYTPNANATGTDTFTYRAMNADGASVATVTITIIPLNRPPTAVNDVYSTEDETPLTIPVPGLLGNDTDPDSDPLTAILVTAPTQGTLTLKPDGSFIYTPWYGATGKDTFTYKANDGSLNSNTATVEITIIPAPHPTIEGTVIDAATGQPVAGAGVKVSADFNGDGKMDLIKTGVTGADGRYRFEVARRDWTYTAEVTALVQGPAGPVSVTTTHQTEVRPWTPGIFKAERKIAGRVLTTDWQITGLLLDTTGAVVGGKPVIVHTDGTFEAMNLAAGGYLAVLQVTAPDGSQLAGTALPATVGGPGELVIGANLINPLGQVADAVSLQPVDGATVTLYWADTKLNRDLGRVPDTRVLLPNVPDLLPGLNATSQQTGVDGLYAWLAFPEGDYYIKAESDRYLPYDSRAEGRDVAGQDTYVQDGVIHVGRTAFHYDFVMEPIHRRFFLGYPDGTFKPERFITRAEVAALLARNTEPAAVTLPAPPFPDVPASHWAAAYIELVREKGFMEADAYGNFRPDEAITRAELASAISRFEGLMKSDQIAFSDIQGNWAEREINAAFEAGLVKGYPDGTFQPDSYTRRDEAAAMFNRMLGRGPLSGRPQATWPDVPLTNWASGDVEEASNSHSAVRDPAGGERWTGDTGETTW